MLCAARSVAETVKQVLSLRHMMTSCLSIIGPLSLYSGMLWPLLSGDSTLSWGLISLSPGHSPMTLSLVWRGNNTPLLWSQKWSGLGDRAMMRETKAPGSSVTKQECSLDITWAGAINKSKLFLKSSTLKEIRLFKSMLMLMLMLMLHKND